MENYRKAETVEQPSTCPFSDLQAETPEVRVKDGSKIRNLLRFSLGRLEATPPAGPGGGPEQERPLCQQLVFTASGKGVSKAITCAEMVKRRVKGLHQLTRLQYCSVSERWEPLAPGAGLDALTVSRKLPALWILLSRQPLDRSQPGYQAPGCYDGLWTPPTHREEGGAQRAGPRRRRGGGGGGGRGKGGGRQPGRPRDGKDQS